MNQHLKKKINTIGGLTPEITPIDQDLLFLAYSPTISYNFSIIYQFTIRMLFVSYFHQEVLVLNVLFGSGLFFTFFFLEILFYYPSNILNT